MPFATNHGVRINYEVEGEGPPLMLQHGLGASLEFWRMTGFVEPLAKDYRLILVDPRGHGSSDKPHDPEAYRLALRAADSCAVLDDMAVSRTHFCGYSMGGWTGWCMAKYAPERLSSLIIGGCSLFPDWAAVPDLVDLCQQGMEAFLDVMGSLFGPRWTPEVRAMFSANDLEALIALLSVQDPVDVDQLLSAITVPCLLYGGAADPLHAGAEQCTRRMPNATVISLPGLDHIEAQYQPDLMLPHIRKFLAAADQA